MNDISRCTVSVLVPLYNHARTIERALASVMLSDASRVELIVCDDASTDDSFEVASKWIGRHLERFWSATVVRNSKNLGITGNLNRLMEKATGEFVTLLASDDELNERAIDQQVEFLRARPGLDFVFANYGTIDAEGYIVCPRLLSDRHVDVLQRQSCAFVDIVFNWSPAWTRLFARRIAHSKMGPYPVEYSFEDRWATLRIAQSRRFGFMHEVGYLYRVRPEGLGTAGLDREKMLSDTLKMEELLVSQSTGALKILLFVHVHAYVRSHRWASLRVVARLIQRLMLSVHKCYVGG